MTGGWPVSSINVLRASVKCHLRLSCLRVNWREHLLVMKIAECVTTLDV